MSLTPDPKSAIERFVGGCVGLLVAALALNWSVHLVEEVWVQIVIGGLVLGVLGTGVWLAVRRSRRW